MSKDKELVNFVGEIVRNTFSSTNGGFKIYAVNVNRKLYPKIKVSETYGTCTIKGELHDLDLRAKYNITAMPTVSKYGVTYDVVNIKREKPTTHQDTYLFLQEVLTPRQADILLQVYPNIVDLIVNEKDDQVDLNKLKGIKEYTFSKIKEKIMCNFMLSDLVVEFKGCLSFKMIKKLYDKYHSVEKLKRKLSESPYTCLCDVNGVGFKTADMILLDMNKRNIIEFKEPLLTSKDRCFSCVMYLLMENETSGNTVMNLKELKNQIDTLVPECSNLFGEVIQQDDFYISKSDLNISRKTTNSTEYYIADTIKTALENNIKWDFDVARFKSNTDYNLTEQQITALQNVCDYNVSILNGYSGSGKSSTTEALIKMLKHYNKSFKIFAPTGKASKVVSDYTGETAMTIHRGLGYHPPEWFYNEDNKIESDIIIVDEFSMCDIWLFRRLLEGIDVKITKLLLIGDSAQLPSVGCGNVLQDLISSNKVPTTTLTQIFRYGKGGVMTVATDVRGCKKYLPSNPLDKPMLFGENNDYIFIPSESEFLNKKLATVYKKCLEKCNSPSDIQVLTSYNKGEYGTINLNNLLQKIANPNSNNKNAKSITSGNSTYYIGDIVMQTVNNYNATVVRNSYDNEIDSNYFVANGESGVVTDIIDNGTRVIIDFGGVKVIYNKSELIDVSLGYCITVHKSQGGSNKIIIMLTPSAHTYMLNSNLLYVALTRTTKQCYHIGTQRTVNLCVKKKANMERKTSLKNKLKKINKNT